MTDARMEMDRGTWARSDHELIEPGEASARLDAGSARGVATARARFDVIVVGAGQAGLSVGYYLAKRGYRFVILDANLLEDARPMYDKKRFAGRTRTKGHFGFAGHDDPVEFRSVRIRRIG